MANKQQVEALLDKGLTVREIADRIGAMREYVSTTLHRNGWLHRVKRRAPYPNLRALNAELLETLKFLLENCYVPDKACSCHINPPCGDCYHNGGLREAMEMARAAIAKAETKP